MKALQLAALILARDALIGLVASLGWPRWPWLHRAVDRCQGAAEALRSREEVGA